MASVWATLRVEQRGELKDDLELRSKVTNGVVGDQLAVLDRHDLSNEVWRKVILERIENETFPHLCWALKSENGELVDEPPDCPKDGFSEESLLLDIGTEYYCVPTSTEEAEHVGLEKQAAEPANETFLVGDGAEELAADSDDSDVPRAAPVPRRRLSRRRRAIGIGQRSPPAERDQGGGGGRALEHGNGAPLEVDDGDGDALPEDLDLVRIRVKQVGPTGTTTGTTTGTIRTRDGSGDSVMPANKVMYILDGRGGEHQYYKREDLEQRASPLIPTSDPVSPALRPVTLVRHNNSSTNIDGVLLGQIEVNFASSPDGVTELEVFAGLHFAGRPGPISIGSRVFAHAAAAATRPKKDIFLAFFLRGKQGNQRRINALLYCAEDGAFVQVGMSHVMQPKNPEKAMEGATPAVLQKMRQGMGDLALKDFKSAQTAGQRAEKRADEERKVEERKAREARAAELAAQQAAAQQAAAQQAAAEQAAAKARAAAAARREQRLREQAQRGGGGDGGGGGG